MAKKSRRKRKRQIRLSETQLQQPGVVKAAESRIVASATEAPDLQEEYGYVFADLKRMSIVAAAALVLVIVLVLVLT